MIKFKRLSVQMPNQPLQQYEVDMSNLAGDFSASTDYVAGQYVYQNGNVYRFNVDHPKGAWNAAHVTQVTVGGELSALKQTMTGATSSVAGSAGLVPAPSAGDENKVLKGDGTWGEAQGGISYGYCTTAGDTQAKEVSISEVTSLAEGLSIRIKFQYMQNYNGTPTLNVSNTGAKNIKTNGTNNAGKGAWQTGEIVDFVYDGTNWVMQNGGIASKTAYGETILSSAVNSTDEDKAATPKAVKTTYDLAYGKADDTAFTGATSSVAGSKGLVPAPAAGDNEKYLKGDGTWGEVSGANVSAAFTDVNFSIAVADWTAVTGGFKAIVQNSAFTATSKIWYFLNADYYENAPAPFNFEVVAGGVEITTEEKPIGVVSGVLRTVEAIPVTDATEQVLAGTLRVVPFSILKTDWTLENGLYKYNKATEYVTLSSVEFVEYDSSFRDAIRGDIEAVKTTGGGGMTFVTNVPPVGTLAGEIRVFDRNDGKVAILTEQTALPTIREVPFTVEVSDWAINAGGKYEAVFETVYITSTSHDFVEFDESIENATDGIKVVKAKYDGEVIGLKFVSRRVPAGSVSGTVTPLDNADGKVAVALQDTVMPIANGGTGANTLQGAQDALGITELKNSTVAAASDVFTPASGIIIRVDGSQIKVGNSVSLSFSLKHSDESAFSGNQRIMLGSLNSAWAPDHDFFFVMPAAEAVNGHVSVVAGGAGIRPNGDVFLDYPKGSPRELYVCANYTKTV